MPSAAFCARISDSVMAPAATAAPSVLTARPIQAPATSGSCDKNVWARNGSNSTSTTANTTNAEDRDTGRERRRPFAIKAEPFAGHEINDCPIDQIGFDDGRDAAQQERTRQRQFAGGCHRKEAPEDHDRDLDVELGAYRFFYTLGETRKNIGDHQA